MFSKFGEIVQVKIGKRDRPDGFVYVEFKDNAGLAAAISMDEALVNGKKINCRASKTTISGEAVVVPQSAVRAIPKAAEEKRLMPVRRSMVMVPRAMQRSGKPKPKPAPKSKDVPSGAAAKEDAIKVGGSTAPIAEKAETDQLDASSMDVDDEETAEALPKAKSQDEFRRLMMAGNGGKGGKKGKGKGKSKGKKE